LGLEAEGSRAVGQKSDGGNLDVAYWAFLLGYRVAELAHDHKVSTLGAEAVAAAENLGASLCVWDGDDGPGIREAARATGVTYRAIPL
jgi:hypothetical protein